MKFYKPQLNKDDTWNERTKGKDTKDWEVMQCPKCGGQQMFVVFEDTYTIAARCARSKCDWYSSIAG